jgi:hypothetical protein
MRRKALIIANQDGLLQGVSKDIDHITNFLHSVNGGAWEESEIQTLINPKRLDLAMSLLKDRAANYDYMMCFFTGHGGSIRDETYVQINNTPELFPQSSLENLATRQLNIYDCCRSELETKGLMEFSAGLEAFASQMLTRAEARLIFERKIMAAQPQQLVLYSCSIKEYSYDESTGAMYLTSLLKDALNHTNSQHIKGVKIALESHSNTVDPVRKKTNGKQNPDYRSAKFINVSDHLIISISSNRIDHY